MVENKGLIPKWESVAKGDIGKKRKMIAEICEGCWKSCIDPDQQTVVERLTWMGVGDVVNDFRRKVLKMRPYTIQQATKSVLDLKVPWTFCWSPSLIPKPVDWGNHIAISGFYFLDQATNYTPPDDLQQFLSSGAPPIYIGFGSITGHDPVKFTATILEGVKSANVRAIVSKGWMGMGAGADEDPWIKKNVFFIGDCPHDWLFKHVDAVCHHGGAGTLSAGLRCGKPTIVVPFFGDQFFWGAMVYRMKAGPLPLPATELTSPKLGTAITTALSPETRQIALQIASQMAAENGVRNGVASFHSSLPWSALTSDINKTHAASLSIPKLKIQVSRNVAQVLACAGVLAEEDFRKLATRKWYIPSDHDGVPGTAAIRTLGEALSYLITKPAKKARKAGAKGFGTLGASWFAFVGFIIALLYLCWWPYEACYYTYNELADAVARLPSLYDRYSQPPRLPIITGLATGFIEGCKDIWWGISGVADLILTPLTYTKKHNAWVGWTLGFLIGILHCFLKPFGGVLRGVGCWFKGSVRQVLKRKQPKKIKEGGLGVTVPKKKKKGWAFWRKPGREISADWVDVASQVSGYDRAECERIVMEVNQALERRRNEHWWRR
ncbi:hypothetical protein HDV00_007661 [Rhizophlyctis rosea]|nr:hypothetical protein HDV00_007661 [Rhizophlyctis rosea]